jgi:tetratricopeptide (TPR) repeat protein
MHDAIGTSSDMPERADGPACLDSPTWFNCPTAPNALDRVDDEIGSLLAAGADALTQQGDLGAARRRYDTAYQMAERAGDEAAMALAALGMGGLWVHEYRTAAGSALLEQRLSRALSTADPRSTLALRLRVRLSGQSDYSSGDSATILAALGEARAAGDPVTRAEALSLAHDCLLGPGNGRLRRELATELIGESFRTGRRSDLLVGLLWRTADLFADGDPHAHRQLEELRQELAREDHRGVSFVVAAMDVMLAIRSGDLERAERLAEVCAKRGEATGAPQTTAWHAAHLLTIRWYQGRVGEALPTLNGIVHSPVLSAMDNSMNAALAVAAAAVGDHRAAASALAAVCGRDLLDLPRSGSWLATMNGVVEAAHLLGDASTAGRAYELLLPYADLPMVGSLGITCLGSVHHALGVACLTTGDLDQAVTHLHTAITRNLALAHWPAVITSRQRLAQALNARARSSDADDGRRELAAAADEAAAVGLPAPQGQGTPSTAIASCTRQGRRWRIDWGERSVILEHRVGLLHLAVLLANPRQEIDAVDLVAGVTALDSYAETGSIQPVIDQVALGQYQLRLTELDGVIDAAESRRDQAHGDRARAERDWLRSELTAAAGLGGRTRPFADSRELARLAVGKSIRRTVQHVAEADAMIGGHLRHTVRTGTRCSYWPS